MAIDTDVNAVPSLEPANFEPEDIIRKDVCIIGGGCNGTYTAIRPRDFGKSTIVIEKRESLGGHASTYTDPDTGVTLDIGVIVFGHLQEVKDFFARFDVPLKTAPTSLGSPTYVDFSTGERIDFTPPSQGAVAAAFQRYSVELSKYPTLQEGFHLTRPVPGDLLLPFGRFVKKYSLDDLLTTTFAICQGYTPLLELSTIYVLKYFNAVLLNTLSRGFLMSAKNNVSELYHKAANKLGDDALLGSHVVAMDRSKRDGPVKVLVETPSGRKLILAKKLVSTVPHKIEFLTGHDLSSIERSLFTQFFHSAFYTGILRHIGLPTHSLIHAVGLNSKHGISELPGIYALNPNQTSGLFQVYYGSPYELPEEEVKKEIIEAVQRVQRVVNINTTSIPEFAVFENHTPFNMMVSNHAIETGFYEQLHSLQGQRHTFYTGASFHTQDSSVLWQFTEDLLPEIVAQL